MSEFLAEVINYVNLRALHPKLAPHFPAIAEKFYAAVFDNPGAAAVLSGPAQVERLRISLIDWMSTGLLGPYDDVFYDKRSRIGRAHVQIGLAQQYMFTAMNVVRTAYSDLLAQAFAPSTSCSTSSSQSCCATTSSTPRKSSSAASVASNPIA